MENTSDLLLSDYQRAVLSEMGVSVWQLADVEHTQSKVENQTTQIVDRPPSAAVSKEGALAKLKQLKVQTQTSETTDSVLVTFLQDDTKFPIFTDVLIALGLETKPQKYISTEQLSHYSGYPLSWALGEKIGLTHNTQLITPTLTKLHHAEAKKLLWQQLQSLLPQQQSD